MYDTKHAQWTSLAIWDAEIKVWNVNEVAWIFTDFRCFANTIQGDIGINICNSILTAFEL